MCNDHFSVHCVHCVFIVFIEMKKVDLYNLYNGHPDHIDYNVLSLKNLHSVVTAKLPKLLTNAREPSLAHANAVCVWDLPGPELK